ncbi:DUF4435 domain-containing protein [Cronbergia sp. UHCC 0137]|uniref:DUF4435 domain-containing protein n=1 Tax=Cronbergia sp. UHCC 0137 TaxID=3110239 RepID=UPI002B1FF0FD|nr:DUF4435 domain-containing protein [Cronbergia sp. UHCC 0137]MEA5619583.1 DUF4435 domain-containing protein [Cronbergia sp. UHCC 0137]
MREHLSVDREANAIQLRRETFSGVFLLVEGSSDKTLYERLVDNSECQLISYSNRKPSSKFCVIEIIKILDKNGFHGVIAIVDADFDHLGITPYSNPNLFRTDTHDLETMLLNSPALEKVIAEFGSEEKITRFGQDIRTVLLEVGTPIGYLRWVSQLDGLNLTFNGIKFSSFINELTLELDQIKLIQEVKNKSQAFALDSKNLQHRLISQQSSNDDPWQVCCGHDLVEILSIGLRKAIGSAKASDVESTCLERSLRLAYEETYFCKTHIYLSIRLWESNNQPFKVLRNEI